MATTLYAVTSGGEPCDGLLFGETVTTTTQHLRDDDDPATVTESHAAIASALCCAASCSFYDQAGELDETSLDALTRQPAPLLGWLSYRPAIPGVPLRPSMRECEVTRALLRRQLDRLGGRQAVLLLLVASGGDHNGATLTWQSRCFQARQAVATGELLLEPVELQTLNLGGRTGQAAYQELCASTASTATSTPPWSPQHALHVTLSSGTSPTHAATVATSGSPPPPQQQQQPLASASPASPPGGAAGAFAPPGCDAAALAAMAAGARTQVAAVRHHCEVLLGGLHELCTQAVAGEAAVAALRQRRDALLAQLARTQ